MKCSIHFFLLNEHFSQGYADSHNQGEESELNRKYLWEDEMEVKGIRDILVLDNSNYQTIVLRKKMMGVPNSSYRTRCRGVLSGPIHLFPTFSRLQIM